MDIDIINELKEIKKSLNNLSKNLQLLIYERYYDDGEVSGDKIPKPIQRELNNHKSYLG
jgi:hypothetical protein|tara:strand:+ start:1765 stop:1941 length:177 start_codon:yes stop_codon:yes gene_type:complete